MFEKYVIINRSDVALFFNANNVKDAICDYANYISSRIDSAIIKKIAQSLSIEEFVKFFNLECWDWGDEIKQIITGYQTLYMDRVNNG